MAADPRTSVERTTRTDEILHLTRRYDGELDTPAKYNRAFASVLREMADALDNIDDAWADPEVTVWMHIPGEIAGELSLSPKDDT